MRASRTSASASAFSIIPLWQDSLSSIRTAVEFRFNDATGVSYRIEASTDLNQWDIIEPSVIGESAVVTRMPIR